ncbi:hypothetical protein D3C87_1868610 [compost metagenome]
MVSIRQPLEASGLPDGEVPHRTIVAHHHVFTTRHTMVASLQRLGRLIERAPSMTRVDPRAILEHMIGLSVRLAETMQRITHGDPRGFIRCFITCA